MFCNSIVRYLRYCASVRDSKSRLNARRLEAYLRVASRSKDSQLISQASHKIGIANVMKLGGGLANHVHSFQLTYIERGQKRRIPLIIKTFIENPYFDSSNVSRCVKEWQVLKFLEHNGVIVPKPYLCELDSIFIGNPFIVMAKVEKSQEKTFDHLNCFATSLAHLHSLKIDGLEIRSLKPPKDGYSFARQWPTIFKDLLNETNHSERHKKYFNFAIQWLESNASNNHCKKYGLVHGDVNLANSIINTNSQIVFIDWENAYIGDPTFDVAHAYCYIKFYYNSKDPDSAEQLAEGFLSEYLAQAKEDVRSRLKFYQVVVLLAQSIVYSSGLSSPKKAYELHRYQVLRALPFLRLPLILFVFPFLRWSFFARQIGAEGEKDWLRYFEKFMDKLN